MSSLKNISPIDGRYSNSTVSLQNYFSEYALIKYRIKIEIEYLIALAAFIPELSHFNDSQKKALRKIYESFKELDAQEVKKIEVVTNHDVKAVEYFVKEQLEKKGFSEYKEWVHFGLTSQDINNTAIPLMIKEAINEVYNPLFNNLLESLEGKILDWKEVSMLSRTHGQPASPTKLGKELLVFVERLKIQKKQLKNNLFSAKFGGAVGNFNAHFIAFPKLNWSEFANYFVNKELGLNRSEVTTQVEHYDNLAALFHLFSRINTIFIDFSRDVWTYISMNYFNQKIVKEEVGSSAMPHKVNPIDFENAEGNFGIANSFFEYLSSKLPISRLQRDLTDSTVLRNIGVPFAHTIIAFNSLIKGIKKIIINEKVIQKDLENNWEVIAEGIQTILRREKYPNPYESLKELTRTSQKLTPVQMHKFIEMLDISEEVKKELKQITPFNYTGIPFN